MFEGIEDGNVEVRSLVKSLREKIGTELGPCDGISVGKDVGKLDGSGEKLAAATGYMDWS